MLIKNGAAPLPLQLRTNGTLSGPAQATIAGRVVAQAANGAMVYQDRTDNCGAGVLTPKVQQ